MREQERPCKTSENYGAFQQHDIVTGLFEGKPFTGEIKSFNQYEDTGEVEANVAPSGKDAGIFHDIHVDPGSLKLKFRAGRVPNRRFKKGWLSGS